MPEGEKSRTDTESAVEELQRANREIQQEIARLRTELEEARAAESLIRESRWWRLGLALRNRRNLIFGLRHPVWTLKTIAGLRTRRGRGAGRPRGVASTTSARLWLAGVDLAPRAPEDLWIAGILDPSTRSDFDSYCKLVTFRPDNWQIALETKRPHLLLVESAERGNDGSWEYRVGVAPHADSAGLQDLTALVEWCRANGTPTVFWHTAPADASERFAEAAGLFDHVVCSSPQAASRLRGTDGLRAIDVGMLPAGVSPIAHNPIGAVHRAEPCAVLVGSESKTATDMLIDAGQSFGMSVFVASGDESAQPVPVGATAVAPAELSRAVADHAIYLNAVTEGVPPLVLSALASRTAVISMPNGELEELFGQAVTFVRSSEEAKTAIERLLADDGLRGRLVRAGHRAVLRGHTARHRICEIAQRAGFDVDPGLDLRYSVVALSSIHDETDAMVRALGSLQPTPAEILIGVREDAKTVEAPGVRVIEQDDEESGIRYRRLAALATAPWVAPGAGERVEDLEDLLLAQHYAKADVIALGDAFQYAGHLPSGPVIARREVVAQRGWPPDPGWFREGIRIFTIAP